MTFEVFILKKLWKKWLNNYFLLGWRNKFSFNLKKKKITFGRQPPGTVSLGKRLFEKVPSDWEKRIIMEFAPQVLFWQRIYSSYGILLKSLTWTICFWECFSAWLIKILLCIYDIITRKCSLLGICCFSNYHSWLRNWYTWGA